MSFDPFERRLWRLARGHSLVLGPQSVLMGIINATPDSFSDGGVHNAPAAAAQSAALMAGQCASIIDVGAESTRPGAAEIDSGIEEGRLLPVLGAILAAVPDMLISVDTYRASTAEKALRAGAVVVNDVWGLQRDPDLAFVASDYDAGVVIMHTSRDRDVRPDVVEDQKYFFDKSLSIAARAGIRNDQIVLDPGFGFGKQADDNFELMARFEELQSFGFPLLAGTSRKRFIGAATGRDAADRDVGTAATTALLRAKGAAVFRVHNVANNADAARLADAMIVRKNVSPV